MQTCTVKKKKDLVKFQQEKYASILNSTSHATTPKIYDEFETIGITENEMNEYIIDAMKNVIDIDNMVTASTESLPMPH